MSSRTQRDGLRFYTLRTLVLSIIITVLALPLFGIATTRILESFLHRQTESKLIAEAAYIKQVYIEALREDPAFAPEDISLLLPHQKKSEDEVYQPVFARLDMLTDPLYPPATSPRAPSHSPHPTAASAGKKITPLLLAAQRQNLSGVRVLDPHGTAVASTGDGLGLSYAHLEEVQRAMRGEFSSLVRLRESPPSGQGKWNRASRMRIHVAFPVVEDNALYGVVYLNRTSLSLFVDVWEDYYTTAMLLIFFVTIAIGLLLSHLIISPLRALIAYASRLVDDPGAPPVHVSLAAPAEAHELALALNRMVNALRARMTWVSEFTRNVSHEFKTPLTSIRGSVEILQSNWRDMTDEERERFIDIIEKDAMRMNRLVDRLTALTRIENTGATSETTDLIPLLSGLAESAEDSGTSIEMKFSMQQAEVVMAKDLAETLFTNLIENALRHGNGKHISITVEEGPVVTVSDKGPGISPANMTKIFDRFFTTARDTGGTGLGLSMVQTIAHAHGAAIKVTSDANGTSFAVHFAAAREREN